MNMKRTLTALLSVCMLATCTIPAYAVSAEPQTESRPYYTTASAENKTVPIPGTLLDAMEDDVEIQDFFRFISVRDVYQFMQKMKEIYSSFDTSARTLTTSWDLAYMDSACSGAANDGPIGVVPAQLNGEDVTLVVLGGTQFVDGQATGVKEDILSAMEQSNDYLKNIVTLFYSNDENGQPIIPADKPVIVSGISLGGMVAQQLLAQKQLMKDFDIQQIICFGSPLLAPLQRTRDTRVVRFCDTMDIVPYLGRSKMLDIVAQEVFDRNPSRLIKALNNKEMILKDGGYKSPISAHTLSYVDGDCWAGYDILGVYGGDNQLVMEQDMMFFANPSLS